jgi:hypothetical protein
MYRGWARFAGNEIFNNHRLSDYAAHGFVPTGVEVKTCDECRELGEVNGEGGYNSPLVDQAPWFDPNDQASWEFAGILPLAITGLSDSTRTAAVTERISNGGTVSRGRYATRTIGVSALLLGATNSGVHAGMEWLTSVLAGSACDDGSCAGGELCFLTDCPLICDTSTDPATPLLPPEVIPPSDLGWVTDNGTFSYTDGSFDPSGSSPAAIGRLAAPIQSAYDEVKVTWTVTALGGPFTVASGFTDADGATIERGDPMPVLASTSIVETYRVTPDKWRPALWISNPGARVTLTIQHRAYLSVDDCVDPYLRTFRDVRCIDGPHVTDEFDVCDVTLQKVSWTWVAGLPGIYRPRSQLTGRLRSNGTNLTTVDKLAGVQVGYVGHVSYSSTDCVAQGNPPASATRPCYNSCCADLTPPPRLPVIADPCIPVITQYDRTWVTIPDRYVPVNTEGTMVITFTALDGRPKIGTRLRLYPDPLQRGYDLIEECGYCSEFNLTFQPGISVVTMDGSVEEVRTQCTSGGISFQPVVRGDEFSIGFDFPVLACGTAYVLVIDQPLTYDRDCDAPFPNGYAQGASQGVQNVAVAVVPRQL